MRTRILLIALFTPHMLWAQTADKEHPVVIELFTSQGCSSCPPADRLVGSYADRKEVLPLSFHVTYWNNIGWKDPYSKEGFTKRQHEYKLYLGRWNVYTPQAVVQGTLDVVGSQADNVFNAVTKAATSNPWIDMSIKKLQNDVEITLDENPENSRLLLIGYQKEAGNQIPRGENAGTIASHRNTVLELINIGTPASKTLTHPIPAGDGIAVLLQSMSNGQIIGASWL